MAARAAVPGQVRGLEPRSTESAGEKGLLLLRQAWGLSIDFLCSRGLSRGCIDVLRERHFVNVEDLARLDAKAIYSLPLDPDDKARLRGVWDEVLAETASRHREQLPEKNTFIHFPERVPSLEEGMDQKVQPQSCPPKLIGCEIPTVGSAEHKTGKCEPCAWHHTDGGCWHGQSCIFCHLCPEGEIKRRKRVKRELRKKGTLPPKEPGSDEKARPRVLAGPPIHTAYPPQGIPLGHPGMLGPGIPLGAVRRPGLGGSPAIGAFQSADSFTGFDRMPVNFAPPVLPPSPHGARPQHGLSHFMSPFMGHR